MDNKNRLCRYLAHVYFLCSVVGFLLLPSANCLALILLSLGSSSVYVSIGIFLSALVSEFWGICAFGWSVLFPIGLVVSYVFALRKHYRMLLLVMVLDTMVSVLFAGYSISAQNWHGLGQAILFTIVGLGVLVCFVRSIPRGNPEPDLARAKALYVMNFANHMTMQKNGEFKEYQKFRIPADTEREWSLEVKDKLLEEILSGENLLQVQNLSRVNLPETEILEAFQHLAACSAHDQIYAAIQRLRPLFEPKIYEKIIALFPQFDTPHV